MPRPRLSLVENHVADERQQGSPSDSFCEWTGRQRSCD